MKIYNCKLIKETDKAYVFSSFLVPKKVIKSISKNTLNNYDIDIPAWYVDKLYHIPAMTSNIKNQKSASKAWYP